LLRDAFLKKKEKIKAELIVPFLSPVQKSILESRYEEDVYKRIYDLHKFDSNDIPEEIVFLDKNKMVNDEFLLKWLWIINSLAVNKGITKEEKKEKKIEKELYDHEDSYLKLKRNIKQTKVNRCFDKLKMIIYPIKKDDNATTVSGGSGKKDDEGDSSSEAESNSNDEEEDGSDDEEDGSDDEEDDNEEEEDENNGNYESGNRKDKDKKRKKDKDKKRKIYIIDQSLIKPFKFLGKKIFIS
jgi:hypothetical protein